MFWFLVIGIGAVIAFAALGAAKKNEDTQKRAELSAETKTRVDSYADYLKRTAALPDVAEMTENELKEFIQNNIRQYGAEMKSADDLRAWLVIGGVVVGAIVGFAAEDIWPFFVCAAGGAYLGQKHYKKMAGELDVKYRGRGLDPERLQV